MLKVKHFKKTLKNITNEQIKLDKIEYSKGILFLCLLTFLSTFIFTNFRVCVEGGNFFQQLTHMLHVGLNSPLQGQNTLPKSDQSASHMVPITYSTYSIYSIFYAPSLFLNTHGYVCIHTQHTHTHTHTHIYIYTVGVSIACVLVTQLCPTLCNPTDHSLPGSSVHGILQARILEWVAIPFSRGSSWPRDQTWVSRIAGRFFTVLKISNKNLKQH